MVSLAELEKLKREAKNKRWEDELIFQISTTGMDAPEREYRFDTRNGRKWRFDMAWVYKRIAVEVHGGVWIKGGGRHNREIGKDAEKRNAAQLQGWDVYEFTPDQIKSGAALCTIQEAMVDKMGEF
jgi:hypothetical protein